MGGFLGPVLDPGGIFTGNGPLADTGSPQPSPTVQDNTPSVWQREGGFFGPMVQAIQRAQNKVAMDKKLTVSPGARAELLASAYDPDAKPAVAPFQPQWSYAAGKGPQWIEPKQTYARDGGDQWKAEVNTGPVKGNRF